MPEAFGLSDLGCVRKNNEDSLLVSHELGLYLVADGMGGARGGEHASRLAISAVLEYIHGTLQRDENSLLAAFERANFRVWERAAADPSLEGMGTTLVGVMLLGGPEIALASVGDSRIYVFHGGVLTQLTEDQTWINEVGRRLGMSEERLKVHPMRHVLTMAVGVSHQVTVKTGTFQPPPGCQILLCSDGLHGPVSNERIQEILISPMSLEARCQALIQAARDAGGPDNVTAILLQF